MAGTDECIDQVASRILRGHMPNTGGTPVKIWSDLHGDMQSQAERETTWPPIRKSDRR